MDMRRFVFLPAAFAQPHAACAAAASTTTAGAPTAPSARSRWSANAQEGRVDHPLVGGDFSRVDDPVAVRPTRIMTDA